MMKHNNTKSQKKEMMKDMMKKRMHEKHAMMEECMGKMKGKRHQHNFDSYSTEELNDLFLVWLAQVEDEIIEFVKTKGETDIDAIATEFSITGESTEYIVNKLKKENKI